MWGTRVGLWSFCSLAASLAAPAGAFAPGDGITIGIEPARVYTQTAAIQRHLSESRHWAAMKQDFGGDWEARFDELTGYPRRISGQGLPMKSLKNGDQLADEILKRLNPHSHFLGLSPNSLQLRSANYVERIDTWYLEWDSVIQSHEVYRGGVSARVKHGNLISLGFNTYGMEGQSGQPELSKQDAVNRAIANGPAPHAPHENQSATLMWLPVESGRTVDLRLTWQVKSETEQPVGQWVTFVDAASGDVLSVHNEVRFLTGSISSTHHQRHPGSSLVTSRSPDQWVYTDTNEAYTDQSGVFELTNGEGVQKTAELRGRYLRVYNEDGSSGRLRFTGDSATWTTDSATQAEIDSFTFLHQIRDWGEAYAPEVRMSSDSLRSYVNKTDGNCNAYYNGDVNFFARSGNCNNTAEIADVNYHEWGHGFHYYSVAIGGGIVDGSVGEGVSDVVSILQTRDPVMARYFFTNGNGIRTANNDRRYPEDLVNEVHADGTIFSGAIWDLLEIFAKEMTEDEAYDLVSSLTAGMLKGGPALDSTWDEIIVADDDDGNLANGTPHYCQLLEAFGNHGLGPGAVSGSVVLTHTPLVDVSDSSPHGIEADVTLLAQDCVDFVPNAAFVQFRVNGGEWQQEGLSIVSDAINGAIPQQSMGDFVEYFVTVEGNDGEVTSPPGSYINPHSFFVGDVIELYCTDFEDSDAEFTHSLLAGENTEGADDWQWGIPLGKGGDPDSAWSGEKVWGNDLGPDNYNGEYQNDKHNRLESPALPVYHYEDVFLNYRRWLHVEDGYYDNANILANDEVVWDNYDSNNEDGGYHHQDYQWESHAVDLQLEPGVESVRLAWDIVSDGGLTMGGWTIDDVCLYAPATPNNRLAITDFQASDDIEGGITLTWTHPLHAPVQKVVVVRNASDFPGGPTDGAIVETISDPELGAPISMVDEDVRGDDIYYYAVYGYDGDEWLGWTREGWNADVGLTSNMPGDGDIEFAPGGCACASAFSLWPATSGLFGASLFVMFRRRRTN